MRLSTLLLLLLLSACSAYAQQDTIYTYFNINKKGTQPATAFYVSKTVKENNRWHKQVFVIANEHVYMDGYYTDEKTHIPDSVIKYYSDNEKITDSCFFINGQLKARYSFYKNGRIKNYVLFTHSAHITEQGGYTEEGQKIDNYIVWRPAMYPDSTTGWQKYINKKIKRHQPAGFANGLMNGNVEIAFTIDTSGVVTNATIIKKSDFIDLDQHALSVIEKSPKWMPAIANNQPVSSVQKQTFIFTNNELNAQIDKSVDVASDLLRWIIF